MSEIRFYCKWCDTMKPIEKFKEEVDKNEYVTWTGCKDCYKKYLRRD